MDRGGIEMSWEKEEGGYTELMMKNSLIWNRDFQEKLVNIVLIKETN